MDIRKELVVKMRHLEDTDKVVQLFIGLREIQHVKIKV